MRVFDAFTRAENSTTNKVQGTGFGMAITKNIIELMGGTIDVFSEVDEGSLFWVELEFRIPERQSDRRFWEEQGITKILVADADKDTCENIGTLMGGVGVATDVVHSMEEALTLLGSDASGWQVILLGGNVVHGDASKAISRIREKAGDMLSILFWSDHGELGSEEIDQTGNVGILLKPFFASAFKEKMQQMQMAQKTAEPETESIHNLAGLHF